MRQADDDSDLIAAALRGSSFAWNSLVQRYEKRIYNMGLRLTGNPSDAMDLMQDVFLGVYRNLHRFRGDSRFSSWIYRIAHNKAMDINRRRKIMAWVRTDDQEELFAVDGLEADQQSEPLNQVSDDERNQFLMKCLAEVPFEQRLLVELKVYQSRTFEEIAEIQDISVNTAKTRFYTALRKLRSHLEESDVVSED